MSKLPLHSAAVREALRRLGNPYATLQIFDEDCEQEAASDFRPLTEAERIYVRRLENPYASLSVAVEVEEAAEEQVVSVPFVLDGNTSKPAVSQRDFEAECRRIFRQYIPSAEKGRIRPHHRAFIERNRSKSPSVRYYLLEGLRRYDLSGIPGIQTLFNREREELTAAKLAKIERAVIGEKTE